MLGRCTRLIAAAFFLLSTSCGGGSSPTAPSDPAAATVTSLTVTLVAVGTVTIIATYQGVTGQAARRAGLAQQGVHILRHTFCSHLSMRGVPVAAIQELAGHQDLATTQRYMHLSPAVMEGAIRLLDQPVSDLAGEI